VIGAQRLRRTRQEGGTLADMKVRCYIFSWAWRRKERLVRETGRNNRWGEPDTGKCEGKKTSWASGTVSCIIKKKKEAHAMKKYIRTGVKATVFLAIIAVAVWYGMVMLLVYRAD